MKVADLLITIVRRFLLKKPKFFKGLQIISICIAVLTGLPAYLMQQGFVLPEGIQTMASELISKMSLVAALISQLTVEKPENI